MAFKMALNGSPPTGGNIYAYGTFTNWRPRPLIHNDDLEALAYVDYVPPGNHFYQLSKRSTCYFTEKVAAEAIRMHVKPREGEPPYVALPKKEKPHVRRRFEKATSVFKDFVEDSDVTLRRMMDADLRNGKFNRIIKSPEAFAEFKETLFVRYRYLKSVFIRYISQECSVYPGISFMEFGRMCRDAKILDPRLKGSDIDRAFIAANYEVEESVDNPDSRLCRFEFIEAVLRLALTRFFEQGGKVSQAAVFEKFMDTVVRGKFRNATEECENFRRRFVYSLGVNDVLACNMEMVEKLYKKYTDKRIGVVTLENARQLVQESLIFLPDRDVVAAFSYSKMSLINELEQTTRYSYTTLLFSEFLEFIVRIADLCFRGTESEDLPLHLKVDSTLENIATILGFPRKDFVDLPEYYEDDDDNNN
eukprot:TRINITY_DN2605_c0_g1_i1.p2 TRINITY_DN2605_c0_g1~~TRINITY_DN2605_c0_g1_i1.p2  ORF type:complete len:419 (+),score=96.01 TRINITY_DN2605_c0_g1_i1:266-1522(+)